MIAEAAPMAEHDPSTGGNPVPLTAKDYEALYRKAIAASSESLYVRCPCAIVRTSWAPIALTAANDRIELRTTTEEKRLLAAAAAHERLDVTSFIMRTRAPGGAP